ncbi:HNH endonuclease signature motif containing protein [Microbispora sp. H11081]|uniref:HNH endonuclease signature motif containing protein n=1 Tax=Microbispora sp. H11081 TaxID=2729107 RepID=UPI0014745337|nr:HNH endonuclease signature motif containing protein [Microbispora sp. H11081]
MLADIDVERVSGFDTVEVLRAAYRQSCHDRARFLQALLEVGLREQFSGDSVVRLEVPDEFAPDEARAALVWSRRRADSAFELAWNLHRRLPALGEAMLAGELDEPRAAAFIRWTSGLTDAQAGWVCEHLIGRAPTWTVGELIEHIQRLVLAIDPDWAEKRYREAVRRRRVVGMRNDDGTATVSGLDLPLERAVAGCERIDELARACKRAGNHRPVDHIRADLFLGSLDGSFEGLSDAEIIAHVRAHPFLDPCDAPAGSPDIPPPGSRTQDTTTEDVKTPDTMTPSPAEKTTNEVVRETDAERAKETADRSSEWTGERTHGTADHEDGDRNGHSDGCRQDPSTPTPSAQTSSTQAPPTQASTAQAPSTQTSATQAGATQAWSVREIRVELTTLLGLDEHPAHLPGWGMVHAAHARSIVSGMFSGEWRYAICADDGHLLLTGVTRRRPCPPAERPPRDARRGGVVELHVTLSRLRELAAVPAVTGAWAALVADLSDRACAAANVPQSDPSRGPGLSGQPARSSASTRAQSTQTTPSTDRRQADAALRRYVQIRGQVCSWPGCRMPAMRSDQDHIQAWADNGTTTAENLHLACRHDHRAKHLGGWRVAFEGPRLIVWTSPLGHSYANPLPRIIHPLPEPRPRGWPDPPPERLPTDPPGAPGTIMDPSCPGTAPTGGGDRTTSGEANSRAGRSRARESGEQADVTSQAGTTSHADTAQVDTASGSTFRPELEVPPF